MNIKDNYNQVLDRVNDAAHRAGRSPDEIKIVAVTKSVDSATISQALDLGIVDIGENRVQELESKYVEIGRPANWHFIGRLQSNKVRHIADKVELIHSLDRMSLAEEIDKRGRNINRKIPVLIQVNVAKESTKAGIFEEEIFTFLDSIANLEYVEVKGIMTMAPHLTDIQKTRPYFARLRGLAEDIQSRRYENISMEYLSMGMTNDFEIAIEEGANLLRIGRAIFK